jgi:hypothetical protein
MATDPIPGLGPRAETPRLNPKANFAAARLSPQEGFVLSRVDGHTSLGEICAITGLGEAATIEALQKLKAALLIVTSAPMSELPSELAPPSVAKAASFAGAARGAGDARRPGAQEEGSAAEGSAAGRGGAPRTGGWPAAGPVTESSRLVTPLRDDEIDPVILADGKGLSEDVKRRILAFHKRMADLDYFDRLEVSTEADRQAIRRAYFRLSKEFHPDRYYGKDLGSYGERLSQVFKGISEAFATLSDEKQRQAYVLKLRDAAASPSSGRPKPR